MLGYYFVLCKFSDSDDDYGAELYRSGLYPSRRAAFSAALAKEDDIGFPCEIFVRSM